MVKRSFYFRVYKGITAVLVALSFSIPVLSVVAYDDIDDSAETTIEDPAEYFEELLQEYCEEDDELIYLPSDDYMQVLQAVLDGDTVEEALEEVEEDNLTLNALFSDWFSFPELSASASTSIDDLVTVKDTTNTNSLSSNIFGILNDVLEFAGKIFNTTTDAIKTVEVGSDWAIDVSEVTQLMGKTKVYYSSGTVELVSIGVSYARYYDQDYGMYRNYCQIYGIRQLLSAGASCPTTSFSFESDINAIDGEVKDSLYPVQYNSVSMLNYGSFGNHASYAYTDDEGEEHQGTTSGYYEQLGLVTSGAGFTNDFSETDYSLLFVSLNQEGVTYTKVYSNVSLEDEDFYTYNAGSSLSSVSRWDAYGMDYTLCDVQTNDYNTEVSLTANTSADGTYSPSNTYFQDYSTNTTITNNNYTDYGYTYTYDYDTESYVWSVDTEYYTNVQNTYNETVVNNYYTTYETYYKISGDDGSTNDTTEPVTDPAVEDPEPDTTETTIIIDAEPAYSLDVNVIESDLDGLKSYSTSIDIKKSFWILQMMEYIFEQTGVLPIVLFCFVLSVLGVILWK